MIEKQGNMVTYRTKTESGVPILFRVPITNRTFIRRKLPSKSELIKRIESHISRGSYESMEQFCADYYRSRHEEIEEQTRELVKCLMRIEKAKEAISLIEEIERDQ
ncbi:MAG: hypothetical protein R3254_11530 [Thiomicrorhabdus sp.]|nr:hypothetical protein [Thiomicrorhabdus sp.]